MHYELTFKSSADERYETDQNDRVRLHIEQAGVEVVGEFGGSYLQVARTDPDGSDNGFLVDCDEVTAKRLGHEIGDLLNGRDVNVREVPPDEH